METRKYEEFRPIFFPGSIAVLGVSADGLNAGGRFYTSLLESGFSGGVYAVNPRGGEIGGRPVYTSVCSIPYNVESVIIAVPATGILDVIEDCAGKGVKAAQIYTGGFSESETDAGRRLEKALVEKARQCGILIVGPNCMGVYSPAHKLPYGMTGFVGESGPVGFVSQSGGLGGMVIDIGITKGLKFSKVVSFGNGSMLDSVDYLEYLAEDPATKIIGAYIEDTRNGSRFLHAARRIARDKPMIVLRGGRTEAGTRSVASHTGSLAAPEAVWAALLRQTGVIGVNSLEEMVDTLMVFQHFDRSVGRRLAFISGLTGGGGGVGVSASDAFTGAGLTLPVFQGETQRRLKELLPPVGTIIYNPLDIGGQAIPPEKLTECLRVVDEDEDIDFIVFHERTGFFGQPVYVRRSEGVNEILIKLKELRGKPLVVVSPGGTSEEERVAVERRLINARIPVFPTMERAAAAMGNVSSYWQKRLELHG
ncbi:MAG: CoA-binding protein [Dehalococcoidia bacterium]|nr:CoA-binding protein [Dehalococcoidia bacterium]